MPVGQEIKAVQSGMEVELDSTDNSEDNQFAQEYAALKYSLVHDLGYTKEFADLVRENLPVIKSSIFPNHVKYYKKPM